MKTIFAVLFVLTCSSFASTLRIQDPTIASQASYTSAEYNHSIPFWIWKGQLIDLKKANEVISNPSEMICTFWMMDWTEQKNLTKEQLKTIFFSSADELSLWKRVNGKSIFTNLAMDAAFSYVCVQKTSTGEIVEIDSIEDLVFNEVFQGMAEIYEAH